MEKENISLKESIDLLTKENMKKFDEQTKNAPVYTVDDIKIKSWLSLKDIIGDISFWVLLFSNAFAIFFIIKNNVPIKNVFLIYWMQSVIIGIINVVRILSLKDYTAAENKGNQSGQSSFAGKAIFAAFFAVHYGAFHVGYLIFITQGNLSEKLDWMGAFSIAFMFLISHIFSFVSNFKQETEGKDISSVMFTPYARIIPMHLAIIFGSGFSGLSLKLLLFIKAGFDLLAHVFKHKSQITKNSGNI